MNKTLLQADVRLDSVRTAVPKDPRTRVLRGRAERLDTERRTVVLQDGMHLSYDAVLIATGACPRMLPGREQRLHTAGLSDRITPLRTYDDAERIRRVLATIGSKHLRSARVGIAGSSLLGSETADALTGLGHEVFMIGAPVNPMTRHLGTTIAAWVQMRHREHLAGVIEARPWADRGPGPFRAERLLLDVAVWQTHPRLRLSTSSPRPLVAAGAAIEEAVDVVATTLAPSAASG